MKAALYNSGISFIMRVKLLKHNQYSPCHVRFFALLLALGWVFLSLAGRLYAASGEIAFNRRATATAQILAGITPNPPDTALKRFVETDAFKEHQQWMASSWNQVRGRIQTMESWRSQEIKLAGAQKKNSSLSF